VKLRRRRFFRRRPPRQKEIYLLPTTFTLLNMFFGFSAIVAATHGRYFQAAGYLGLAIVADGLDGRFARMMGATSPMGKELDSLADMVSFGVAPVILVWHWAFASEPQTLSRMGWLVGFIFMAATAIRLARFNVDTVSRNHFVGMPTPATAAVIASTIYYYPKPLGRSPAQVAILIALLGLAALMVSQIRFASLKALDLRSPRSHAYIFPITLFLVLIFYKPPLALLLFAYIYLAINLFAHVRRAPGAKRKAAPEKRPAASGATP
jgi:CDP-diacylglycerol--serine O-phosphatidyltransferase